MGGLHDSMTLSNVENRYNKHSGSGGLRLGACRRFWENLTSSRPRCKEVRALVSRAQVLECGIKILALYGGQLADL